MPTRATNQFRTSSSTPPHPASIELEEFFQSFKVLLQPSNELKIISHSNLSSTTLTLDKHSSTASTTNTGLVYLRSTLWRPASTHTLKTGFVTKEFVKIDEDSQTQDYTIIYIRFQGQTPPFSTHNQDIFESLLPTPFPQVGDILTEEEDSESEQELIAQHYLEQGPNPNSKPCLLSSLQPQLPTSQLSNMKSLQNKILSTIFSTRSYG